MLGIFNFCLKIINEIFAYQNSKCEIKILKPDLGRQKFIALGNISDFHVVVFGGENGHDNSFFSVKKERKLLVGPKHFFSLSFTVETENNKFSA